jgi:hypothetical protein
MFIICVGKHGRLQTMDPGREMKVRRAISRAAELAQKESIIDAGGRANNNSSRVSLLPVII